MSRRLWAHVALAVVGVAVVVWALSTSLNPRIECRGTPMAPGDVCHNAEGTKVQTYDERLEALQHSTPVMVGTGVVIAAFGVGLVLAERRRHVSAQ